MTLLWFRASFHMCSFVVYISSVLIYNVENNKSKENTSQKNERCVQTFDWYCIGMHRYRYQYRVSGRYFVKILVLVFELPIPSADTTQQNFTASNWSGYVETKCDWLSYLSYTPLPA